jgi:aspartate carbamoyltransferase regulatory subunit
MTPTSTKYITDDTNLNKILLMTPNSTKNITDDTNLNKKYY